MSPFLLVFAVIIVICVFLNKLSSKLGIPVLLFFLMLGLLFGMKDPEFADNTSWLVGDISTIALIFGSVSSSVSGAGPSDSLDIQI